MIQAKDLQIGNVVESYGTNGSPKEWVNIIVNIAHMITCVRRPDWFRGIPITEEILLKSGFVYREYIPMETVGLMYQISPTRYLRATLAEDFSFWYISIMDEGIDHTSVLMRTCNFIHELQNIIYALTKQEWTPNI